MTDFDEKVFIQGDSYIFRVEHRIMEGDCEYDHGPRVVKVPSLLADKYPVTNNRFYRFMKESGYEPRDKKNFLKHWQEGKFREEDRNKPVVWVSHKDAEAFAGWYGCRLLYDHEWQYAAGGKEKFLYPWGDHYEQGRCNDSGREILTDVTAYPEGQSSFGLWDMCGNAHEWTQEVFDDGRHVYTFLRGGASYKASHFWHAEGGAKPNNWHLKFQLLNEGMNRCGTVTFRCAKEVEE